MRDFTIDIAAAVNSDATFETCLLASPGIPAHIAVRAYRGYSSASSAYNAALRESTADIIILTHQDIYFTPLSWERLCVGIADVGQQDARWAVIGLIGLSEKGRLHGEVWSSGLGKVLRGAVGPARANAIDEMVIIVRRHPGLAFDETLPGWHLYAADLIEIARAMGLSTWVISAPTVHHSRPVVALDSSYRKAWYHLRRKWWRSLPVANLICPVRYSPHQLWLRAARLRFKFGRGAPRASSNTSPADIAKELGW